MGIFRKPVPRDVPAMGNAPYVQLPAPNIEPTANVPLGRIFPSRIPAFGRSYRYRHIVPSSPGAMAATLETYGLYANSPIGAATNTLEQLTVGERAGYLDNMRRWHSGFGQSEDYLSPSTQGLVTPDELNLAYQTMTPQGPLQPAPGAPDAYATGTQVPTPLTPGT